eukprot:c20340_g1_i1.p1 GENE.c20340_g1_i1~~c20340_g1_i1.p1  ORF type:complete len:565 (-),score=136.59 c20340_g1_i1:27-1721(-)
MGKVHVTRRMRLAVVVGCLFLLCAPPPVASLKADQESGFNLLHSVLAQLKDLSSSERATTIRDATSFTQSFTKKFDDVIHMAQECFIARIDAGTGTGCDVMHTTQLLLASVAQHFTGMFDYMPLVKQMTSQTISQALLGTHHFSTRSILAENQGNHFTNYEMTALFAWAGLWLVDVANPENIPILKIFLGRAKEEQGSDKQRERLKKAYTKWEIVRAVFPDFHKWFAVWNKHDNGRNTFGGPNDVCYDWLPHIHLRYDFEKEKKPSDEWRCKEGQDNQMGDPLGIFEVSSYESIPALKMTKSTSNVQVKRSLLNEISKKLGDPVECNKELATYNAAKCDEISNSREAVVSSLLHESSNDLEFLKHTQEIKDHVFAMWHLRDSVIGHFCEPGPSERLQYVFDRRPGGASPDKNYGDYTLPESDLKMCWEIMETALATRDKPNSGVYSLIRVFLLICINWIVFTCAVRLTLMFGSRIHDGLEVRQCDHVEKIFDPATMDTMSCTNANNQDSICIVTCKAEFGEQLDGNVRTLFANCQRGFWKPDASTFVTVCNPITNIKPGNKVFV